MAAILSDSTSRTENQVKDLFPNLTQKTQCMVLKLDNVTPWNNPDSLVSAETEDAVHRIKESVVLPLLFLIGGPANVINMAVFYKQGLKERINVCLFSLSLADFLYLTNIMLLSAEQISVDFLTREKEGPLVLFMTNNNLVGFYGFTWVSQIISAIIASERCFCILQPLRSQTVMSTATTTVIIVVVKVVVVGLYFFVVSRYRLMCVYNPLTDKNIWTFTAGQFYLEHRKVIDFLDAFVYGLGIPLLMIVVVVVTTAVTLIKLRQAAVWRAGTSSSGTVSAREVALTLMLVYNSIFFVICVFPVALFRMVWLFVPEMNTGGSQQNLYFMCVWVLDILSYMNASFNIAIYYTMGSRYRQTFWQLMTCRGHRTGYRHKEHMTSVSSGSQSEQIVSG